MGKKLERENVQCLISQKWFETSTQNFHQLLILIGTRFVQNLNALGGSDLDFPQKMSKTSNGSSRPNF